jgi:hypothetical protein
MKIPLTRGCVAIVDDEDYDALVALGRWHLSHGYAAKRVGTRSTGEIIAMHRHLMGLEHGDPRQVHHINHDKLDNRRGNLEVLAVGEHKKLHLKLHPVRPQPRTGGIRRLPSGRYQMRIGRNGYLGKGTFDTKAEAEIAASAVLVSLDPQSM